MHLPPVHLALCEVFPPSTLLLCGRANVLLVNVDLELYLYIGPLFLCGIRPGIHDCLGWDLALGSYLLCGLGFWKWGYSQILQKLWQGSNELSSGLSLELCPAHSKQYTEKHLSPTASRPLNSIPNQLLRACIFLSPGSSHPLIASLTRFCWLP